MAWTNKKGFDFRQTLAFATDPANCVFIPAASFSYPQSKTIDGDTFNCGWEVTSNNDRDRNAGINARLAGIAFVSGGGVDADFRIDLPAAGTWIVEWAFGDASGANSQKGLLLDTSTALITLTETSTATEEFVDATLVKRTSAADWVANNAPATVVFATTICRVRIQPPSTLSSTLAHFSIRQAAAGGATQQMLQLLGVGS